MVHRPDVDLFDRRRMGVLLHPTSLPGPDGIGDIGPEARRFVDWLTEAGASVWQVLPVCPPGGPLDDVPYASWAALAGSPQLISLEDLADDGLVSADELHQRPRFEPGWTHGQAVAAKDTILTRAADRLRDGHPLYEQLRAFRSRETWAVEAARFGARREAAQGAPWWSWPPELRRRDPSSLASADGDLEGPIHQRVARFFMFDRQWARLREYARRRSVRLLGDLPIYVLHDSVDVWARSDQWRLDEGGHPVAVSGTPPDVFSEDGQLWGGPLYDWPRMAQDDYAWWRQRLARAFGYFDAVRIDHFRAFSAYWEVPVNAPSARDGRWVRGPGLHFFETIERYMGKLPLCAEDLGHIDDDVETLLAKTGMPGMKILQFAFGDGPDNPYLPHNIPRHAVVYPGNHDNNTTRGWWNGLADGHRAHVQHYFGRHGDDIVWDLIRAALSSPARLAVVQMQDLLGLDGWARMNDPESYQRPIAEWRNWRWRMNPGAANADIAARTRFLCELYGRLTA